MAGVGLYRRTGLTTAAQILGGGAPGGGSGGGGTYDISAFNWSSSQRPWDVSDLSLLQAEIPDGATVVSLQSNTSLTPYQNLINTLNAASGRIMVRVPSGTRIICPAFVPAPPGTTNITYAFGLFSSKLQGLICDAGVRGGASLEMAPTCMTDAQLEALKTKSAGSSGNPNQMALARIDSSQASPFALIGMIFRSPDQQLLTAVDSTLNQYGVYTPQPAPFAGLVFYAERTKPSYGKVSYCLAEGAGHAMSSLPPFEHANFSSQYGADLLYNHTESDGRIAAIFNPARPRRCAILMANNELKHRVVDCWLHHTNVSRYAANDQNADTSGVYELVRTKLDHISDLHNVDPDQNNGQSLGGVSNSSTMGWESCNATINLIDVLSEVDNNATSPDISHHISLTPVGTTRGNPRGGRLNITRGAFTNPAFPAVDGFVCLRIIDSTYWNSDGYGTTLTVLGQDGVTRLTAYKVSGWPPTSAALAAAGVTPQTHFIVRGQ